MKSQKGKTVIIMETFQRTTIRSRKTAKIALCERCAAALPHGGAAHQQETVSDILQLKEAEEASCSETVTETPRVLGTSA